MGVLRSRAYGLPTLRREGAYRYARSNSGRFVWHEWAPDVDQDADDLELVKQANPASWQTIESLRNRRESPSMTEWQWRRFAAGQWVRGEHSAIDPADWDKLANPASAIPPGLHRLAWLGSSVAWPGHDRDRVALVG